MRRSERRSFRCLMTVAVFLALVFPAGVFGQNLLTNPQFNGSLAGWSLLFGPPFAVYDPTLNAPGSLGGSVKTINNVDESNNPGCTANPSIICVTTFPLIQFVPVTPGTQYDFGGNVFIPSGQSASGLGVVGVSFWDSNGNFILIPSFSGSGNFVTSTGAWMLSSGTVQAPTGAVSARLSPLNGRAGPIGSLQVNFDDIFFQPSCPVTSIAIDRSFTNGVIDGSVAGAGCQVTITVHNLKRYWTNFTIQTVGLVSVAPVGGDLNLYARFGLLPPSGTVSYTATFAEAGPAVSVFADPSVATSSAAGKMNVVQAILNVLPLGSAPTLVVADHQAIVTAFESMPHLTAALAALFQPSPDLLGATRELFRFFDSTDELTVLGRLWVTLDFNIDMAALKGLLRYRYMIINSLVTDFGNLYTAFFQYPAGSISFTGR